MLSNYGNLLIDLNEFEKANATLRKAIEIAPEHKDARQNLVRLDRCKGQAGPQVLPKAANLGKNHQDINDKLNQLILKDEEGPTG